MLIPVKPMILIGPLKLLKQRVEENPCEKE